jgi:hypothetical protein
MRIYMIISDCRKMSCMLDYCNLQSMYCRTVGVRTSCVVFAGKRIQYRGRALPPDHRKRSARARPTSRGQARVTLGLSLRLATSCQCNERAKEPLAPRRHGASVLRSARAGHLIVDLQFFNGGEARKLTLLHGKRLFQKTGR